MKWELDRILNAYEKLSTEGWNMYSELKWGFNFLSSTEKNLIEIFSEMKDFNYEIDFFRYRDDIQLWQLYVTKKEILEAEKLHRRNLAFNELAIYNKSEYDGWDVSKT